MPSLKIVSIGDALLSYFSTNLPGMGLRSIDWARCMVTEPAYLLDPNTVLPCLRLKWNNTSIVLRQANQADEKYLYSLFYYRKQTASQQHQTLLIQDVETICNTILSSNSLWRVPDVDAISGQQLQTVVPYEVLEHNEKRNVDYGSEFEDPNLRVSVAEIKLQVHVFSL